MSIIQYAVNGAGIKSADYLDPREVDESTDDWEYEQMVQDAAEAYWKTQCRGITDHCEELQARIAELESRTVKLPPKVDSSNIPFAGHTWNCCLDEVEKRLAAAGIKWEAE